MDNKKINYRLSFLDEKIMNEIKSNPDRKRIYISKLIHSLFIGSILIDDDSIDLLSNNILSLIQE